jgi:hypothetical protein
VKDRLGAWNQKLENEDRQQVTDEQAKAERLAEVSCTSSLLLDLVLCRLFAFCF